MIEQLQLQHLAVGGYSLLVVFTLYKLLQTQFAPIDIIGSFFLLIGLGALALYNYRLVRTKRTDRQDRVQKYIRYVAHTSIIAFVVISLSPQSQSLFRVYDVFSLLAHSYLLFAVFTGASQFVGVLLLAIYYLLATYPWTKYEGVMGAVQFLGRMLLLIFFTTTVVLEYTSRRT